MPDVSTRGANSGTTCMRVRQTIAGQSANCFAVADLVQSIPDELLDDAEQAMCDMRHRHDQALAIEPNLVMSATSEATNST